MSSISMPESLPPRARTRHRHLRDPEPSGQDQKRFPPAGTIVIEDNRHRSRSRHDPQRGEIQPPAVAPQLRAPVPSAAPPAVPPGYWHVATFARHPPPRPRTPHRGEPPVRAKSAPAERSPPKSSPGSDVPPGVWFAGSGPPQTAWPSGPPGSWRPQPPRPVVPRPGFLSEPKKGNQPPPQTSGARPSSTPAQEKPAKNPDSTSKVKHNVAPVTPPYNPPEREPKATPRKREKKQEPGKASTEKPPAVEKTADEMLDEELRKNTAQSSTDRPAEVDLEQLFIDAHQATGAELLQQSGMAESTETFDTSDPLTPFLAYVLFVLHYRNNPFADSWLIFKHSEMREIRDRKRAVLAHCRPWSTISHSEIDEVCLELLSLFEETPKPESMNSGVFRTFAKALISAKLRVANHFKPGAKSYEVPGCKSKLYFFDVQSFPGPEPRPGTHCLGPMFGCARISWHFGFWASYSHGCLDSWPKA